VLVELAREVDLELERQLLGRGREGDEAPERPPHLVDRGGCARLEPLGRRTHEVGHEAVDQRHDHLRDEHPLAHRADALADLGARLAAFRTQ